MREIIVKISADGETVNWETSGYQGRTCEDATKFLEELVDVKKRTYKQERLPQQKVVIKAGR